MIYFCIIIFFLVLAIQYDVMRKKGGDGFFFVLEAVILICLFGLRYRVGADSLAYEEKWFLYPRLSELTDLRAFDYLEYQPLYYVLVGLVKEIDDSFVAFQIVHAIIVNTCFFITIKRYSQYKFMSVLTYFVFMSFVSNTEILRESLAVSAFMLSIPYLMSKKWIKYYVFVSISIGFHISALMCFVLPFLVSFLEKKWEMNRLIIAIIFLFVFSTVYLNVLPQIPLDFLNETNQEKFLMYSNRTGSNNFWGYVGFLYNCLIILFVAYIMRKVDINSRLFNMAINIKFVFFSCSMILPIMAHRWGGYFNLLYYIILAELVCRCLVARNKVKLYFLLLLSAIVFNYANSMTSVDTWNNGKEPVYTRYYPYHSIFDKQKERGRESLQR